MSASKSVNLHFPYIREGSGETVVVFIHGILGTPRHFDPFIEMVPEQWTIYNILLSGHGGSIDDFRRATMKEWKCQVHQLITELAGGFDHIYIAAHSMGTLFAIDEAVKTPKVKKLFLLNAPLKVFVRPRAFTNGLKLAFGRVREDDEDAVGMRNACSIDVNCQLWKYLGWIPNYLALFSEIRKTRRKIGQISVPCRVIQSGRDELVGKNAAKYFCENPFVMCDVMEKSGHFSYYKDDWQWLVEEFEEFIREE